MTNNPDPKGCLSFEVALPNTETKAALLDVRAKINLETINLEQLEREIGLI